MTLTESGPSGVGNLSTVGTQCGQVSPVMRSSFALPLVTAISEEDDDDLRIIRRLICRKIEVLTSDAWDELEKIVSWLRIIKEVVRGVKRRAYL